MRATDRVGVWLEKSAETIAIMQASLRLGAAYVPLDPWSPPARARKIIEDCGMRALVTTSARAAQLPGAPASLVCLTTDGESRSIFADGVSGASAVPSHPSVDDDLAYILTVGLDGDAQGGLHQPSERPAFIEWAAEVVQPTASGSARQPRALPFRPLGVRSPTSRSTEARRSSSSPRVAYSAPALVEFVQRERPTVWCSVPSALMLMMEHGSLLDLPEHSLRAVLFAGEPFPLPYLRKLRDRWSGVRMLNLYGPTETNVCTYYEVEGPLDEGMRSLPIGQACSGDRAWAEKDDGAVAGVGEEGELVVDGPTVMLGYWGRDPQRGAPTAPGSRSPEASGDYSFLAGAITW